MEAIKEETNFVQTEPNSHFYTDLNQILQTIKVMKYYQENPDNTIDSSWTLDDLVMGIVNTIEAGYNLEKPNITSLENQINMLESFPHEPLFSGSLGDIKQLSAVRLKHINKKINELRGQLIKESK